MGLLKKTLIRLMKTRSFTVLKPIKSKQVANELAANFSPLNHRIQRFRNTIEKVDNGSRILNSMLLNSLPTSHTQLDLTAGSGISISINE